MGQDVHFFIPSTKKSDAESILITHDKEIEISHQNGRHKIVCLLDMIFYEGFLMITKMHH